MKTLQHKFVDIIPDEIKPGILYISVKYCTAIHKCVCGCGNEVVTPLSPTDWELTFNGESVSLSPSIGNWAFDCRSHYWITRNKIRPSNSWGEAEIEEGRQKNEVKKKKFFAKKKK